MCRPDASEVGCDLRQSTQAEAMDFIADLVDPQSPHRFDAHVGEARGSKTFSGGSAPNA